MPLNALRSTRRVNWPCEVAATFLVTAGLLLSSLFALNPHWHHWLHGHETPCRGSQPGHPPIEHQCAAVLIAKGAVEAPEVFLFQPWQGGQAVDNLPRLTPIFLPALEYRLLPGRAPPLV